MMTALGALLLALGAVVTMRASSMSKRAAVLFFGFSAAYILLVGFSTVYWQTQTAVSHAGCSPPSIIEVVISLSKDWLFFTLFLLFPGLIGLLRRAIQM